MYEGLGHLLARSLAAGAFVCLTAAAQKGPVRISGRVTDTMGAVVPDACLTLKLTGSADPVAALRTNDSGEFAFTNIAPDTYYLVFTDRPDPPFRLFSFKSRFQTVKADHGDVSVPTIVLEADPNGPDYEYDGPNPRIEVDENVQKYGKLEVHNQCTVDLGAGKSTCPGIRNDRPAPNSRTDDFWLQADGQKLYFAPINGTTLGTGDAHASGGDICKSVNYSQSRIRIDQLSEGSRLCARTNEGRQAALFVWFKQAVCVPGDLSITFVIYKPRPIP